MNRDKCVNCAEYRRCREDRASMAFFVIGLIAVIAVRAVTILEHISPVYGKTAWYIGILGFFVYFAYKFKVDNDRSRIIKNNKLTHKILQNDKIGEEDRQMIGSVLCALSSNKDRFNYLMIFVSSAVVLVIAFYLDFLK